jgi:FkbM family methyltransferase
MRHNRRAGAGRGGGAGDAVIVERISGHSLVGDWLGPASRIVDLGMNEGRFAAGMRARFGCAVVGAEANPVLAARLGAQPGLCCRNVAITAVRGDIEFYIDRDNAEASSLAPVAGAHAIRVPGLPLADFLAGEGIAEVDLLKLDIEGAELDVLAEADPRVLASIRQICVEFHIFRFADHAPRVAALLRRMRGLGFLAIDFSRTWEDALLINRRLARLSEFDRLSLLGQKYLAGLGRMLRRAIARPAA